MSLIDEFKIALNDIEQCDNFIRKLQSQPDLLSQKSDQESLINDNLLLNMLNKSSFTKQQLSNFCRAFRENLQSNPGYGTNSALFKIENIINQFTKYQNDAVSRKSGQAPTLSKMGFSERFLKECEKLRYISTLADIRDKLQTKFNVTIMCDKTSNILSPVETNYAPLLEWIISYFNEITKERPKFNIPVIIDIIGLRTTPFNASILLEHLNRDKKDPELSAQLQQIIKGPDGFLNLISYVMNYEYLTTFNYAPKYLIEMASHPEGYLIIKNTIQLLNNALNIFSKKEVADLIQITQSNAVLYETLEVNPLLKQFGFTDKEMISIAKQDNGKVLLQSISKNLTLFTQLKLLPEHILKMVTYKDFEDLILTLKLERKTFKDFISADTILSEILRNKSQKESALNTLEHKMALRSKLNQNNQRTPHIIKDSTDELKYPPLLTCYKVHELHKIFNFMEGHITLAKLEEYWDFINFYQFDKKQLFEAMSKDYGYNVFASLKATVECLINLGLDNDQIAEINSYQTGLTALESILKMARYFPDLGFTLDEFLKLVLRPNAPVFLDFIILNFDAIKDLKIQPAHIITLIDTYHYNSVELFDALTLHRRFFESQGLNSESIIEILKDPNREMIIKKKSIPESPQIIYNPQFFNPYNKPPEQKNNRYYYPT